MSCGRRASWAGLVGFLAVLTLGATAGRAAADRIDAPPANSISLRIETGSHTAPIRGISADREGRYVVTAAEDKTARVWDAATGQLLQVFRPPSSPGNDGKLFTTAMLPNGILFAASGWSAGNDVYLVRRANGEVVHRITGLPNVVTALAFSPDGHNLAVGLWGSHGLRIFTTADDWRNVRELSGDPDVGGDLHGLAWSPDGRRLATTAADGAVRIYEPGVSGLRLLLRKPAQERGIPYGVAYSPDGRQLALGSANLPAIAVLDAANLERQAQIVAEGREPGALSGVSWSPDGKRIFAAGSHRDRQGAFPLCVAIVGKPVCVAEWPLARNTVTSLAALGDGRILFSSADPSWGSVDNRGNKLLSLSAELNDYRNLRHEFSLASDGSAVVVRPRRSPADENAFDLKSLGWMKPAATWAAPKDRSARSSVLNWFEAASPAINGRSMRLEENEVSLTAAVSTRGDRIAVGTNFFIRCYTESGRELWRTAVPGTTWQVNVSADGRWLVAAYSDGTLRWYRMQDGLEQISLLIHPDGRRWVAWTLRGYFAVSPGGEDLLGWQVERGSDRAADFFPASRFRAQYYRPGLIAAVLAQGGEDAALLAQAKTDEQPAKDAVGVSEQLPPLVRILSPEDGSSSSSRQARMVIAVQTPPGSPLLRIKVRINGMVVPVPEISGLRGIAAASPRNGDSGLEVPVPLPESDADIMVFAENKHGFSPPAVVRIVRAPSTVTKTADSMDRAGGNQVEPTPTVTGEADLRPALYVLAVGVSRYAEKSIQLEYSAKDATDLVNLLRGQEGRLYRKVAVKLLIDGEARRDDVLDGLEWIRRQITARDVGVVFIAGHGVNDSDGVYYFLPHDTDLKRLKRSGVIFTEIRNTLVSLPGKALFFVDTCHSGNVLGTGLRSLATDTTAIVNELASAENGVIVFTATTGRQYAQESDSWGNGAFTKALLEGLSGKADMAKSGRVTHKMLDLYVSERVKALTEGSQSPVTIVPRGIPDFPLAVSPAGPSPLR